MTIKSTIKLEYDFSDPKSNSTADFTLEVVKSFPMSRLLPNEYELGFTKEPGNTQKNRITIAVDDEIKVPFGTSTINVQNPISRQAKSLAEELGHTGSLGHTGVKYPGDNPSETDPAINNYVQSLPENTNVMVQRGQAGISSTLNFFQVNKILNKVKQDLGNKVTIKDSDKPIIDKE